MHFRNSMKPHQLQILLHCIGRYINNNLTSLTMTIDGVRLGAWARQLPFWTHLRTFKLRNTNYDFEYDFDLRSITPNLTKLKMSQNVVFELNCGGAIGKFERFIHSSESVYGGRYIHLFLSCESTIENVEHVLGRYGLGSQRNCEFLLNLNSSRVRSI